MLDFTSWPDTKGHQSNNGQTRRFEVWIFWMADRAEIETIDSSVEYTVSGKVGRCW